MSDTESEDTLEKYPYIDAEIDDVEVAALRQDATDFFQTDRIQQLRAAVNVGMDSRFNALALQLRDAFLLRDETIRRLEEKLDNSESKSQALLAEAMAIMKATDKKYVDAFNAKERQMYQLQAQHNLLSQRLDTFAMEYKRDASKMEETLRSYLEAIQNLQTQVNENRTSTNEEVKEITKNITRLLEIEKNNDLMRYLPGAFDASENSIPVLPDLSEFFPDPVSTSAVGHTIE